MTREGADAKKEFRERTVTLCCESLEATACPSFPVPPGIHILSALAVEHSKVAAMAVRRMHVDFIVVKKVQYLIRKTRRGLHVSESDVRWRGSADGRC